MEAFHAWIVAGVVVLLITSLYRSWLKPSLAFLVAVTLLLLSGVITPKESLEGFANEQLAVIIILLVLSEIIRKSHISMVGLGKLFGSRGNPSVFKFKLVGVVASLSAFFNNTPIVAMLIPFVKSWGGRNKVAPSKLLIPLSYAAILGGCCTLIGTSTNLIVNGLATEAGFDSLEIFDFFWVGGPMALIGTLYLSFADKLLPERKDRVSGFIKHSREFLVETEIKGGSNLIDKTVEEAGLRNLDNVFLVEIIRGDDKIAPVAPSEILSEEDVLIFAGNIEMMEDLKRPELGLTLPKACDIPMTNVSEVVLSYNSSLIGKTVKETDFRGRYDGAILAVHRNGEKLSGKIGSIVLTAGDVLLVLTGKDYFKRTQGVQAFYTLSGEDRADALPVWKVFSVIAGVIAAVVLSSLGIIPLFSGLVVVLALALAMGVVPITEIRKSFDINLVIIIALGLALGKAMINSGLAGLIANQVVDWMKPLGVVGMLAGIFIITNLLAAYITNSAAVAIVFPVSVTMAQSMGFDVVPFILIVAFGAAANFITPVGYQTNLMVYGPGGYTFKDYLKVGLPLTLSYAIAAVGILTWIYF